MQRSTLLLALALLPASLAHSQPPATPAAASIPAATPAVPDAPAKAAALAAARNAAAASPKSASAHLGYSAALLEAGLAEQARAEASLAATLDPRSSAPFTQLGIVLEHTVLGVDFGLGFDRAAALTALTQAEALDPRNPTAILALARLYTHSPTAEPYGEGSNLAEAIREFHKLDTLAPAETYQDELLTAMLMHREFTPVLTQLATLPENPVRDALLISATAATSSANEAIRRAATLKLDNKSRNVALRSAAQQLLALGLYPKAADVLDAGLDNPEDAVAFKGQVIAFRYVVHTNPQQFPPTDPRYPVNLFLNAQLNGDLLTQAPQIFNRKAFASESEWQRHLDHTLQTFDTLPAIARRLKVPASAARDLVLSTAVVRPEGDDAHGYTVALQGPALRTQLFFVSLDQGSYRIVADTSDFAPVSTYALSLAASQREPEARALLNWKRSLVASAIPPGYANSDPLGGELFSHFWTIDPQAAATPIPPATLRLAAIALQVSAAPLAPPPPIEPALTAYTAAPTDPNLTLLLATACLYRHDPAAARPYLDKLVAQFPDSFTTLVLMGQYFLLTQDAPAWQAFLAPRLAAHPTDPNLLHQSALAHEAAANFAAARDAFQHVVDNPKLQPNPGDYNNLAWLSLFDHTSTAKSLDFAQQAVALTASTNFGTLHTLGCLYATQGDLTQARKFLLDALTAGDLIQPDSATWFGFGLIAEQLGDPAAALADFRRVTPAEAPIPDPTDTFFLAQQHLKALHAN